jgi:hypothetical protein
MTRTRTIRAAHDYRIAATVIAQHPAATRPPQAHTAPELARILHMLSHAGATTIAIGHGRHPTSVAAARALSEAWNEPGQLVLGIVDWPETAASWLRPAHRLAGLQPDRWVIADTPAGFTQLARRLTDEPGWTPSRTLGFGALATDDLITVTGRGVVDGMTGATRDGGTWQLADDQLELFASTSTEIKP